MYLNHLEIGNFMGIRSARIDFDETTVLIGENDSGKTAILEAIAKILSPVREQERFQFYPGDFHQVRTGEGYRASGPIRIALTFRERTRDEWSFLQGNEMGIVLPDDKAKCQELTLEVKAFPGQDPPRVEWHISIPGIESGQLDNDPAVIDWIRRMNPVYRIRGGMLVTSPELRTPAERKSPDRNPLADHLLQTISRHFDNLLKGTAPDVHAELRAGYQSALLYLQEASNLFEPEGHQHQKIIREILGKRAHDGEGHGQAVRIHHGSAAEMIGMLLFTAAMLHSGTLSADPSSEPVFIFEDPEANLHPMTLESVRLLIERLKWQKVITTQSGDFLAGFPIHNVRRITRADGMVKQFRIDPDSLGGEDLRRLNYHIRMKRGAATFARCWLLVEGESEVWLLPHLARLCGFELAMEGVACVEFAQCGLGPLIKTARQLGIEWHVLADGDPAGKAYTETAKHYANQAGDEHSLRFTRLKERDIEHHMYFNGYANTYLEYSGYPPHVGQNLQPRKVIGRAIHRNSKPFMAIAIVEAISREGSPGVPAVMKNLTETCVKLAKGHS